MNRLSICTQNVIAPYLDRVDTSGWNVGGAITGGWGLRAGHTYTIVNGFGGVGQPSKIITFTTTSTAGWNSSPPVAIDNTKLHRFEQPFKMTGTSVPRIYCGAGNYHTDRISNGTNEANPYAVTSLSGNPNIQMDTWYTIVGYIYPIGTPNGTTGLLSGGIYDPKLGRYVQEGNPAPRWAASNKLQGGNPTTTFNFRTFVVSSNNTNRFIVAEPRLFQIDNF